MHETYPKIQAENKKLIKNIVYDETIVKMDNQTVQRLWDPKSEFPQLRRPKDVEGLNNDSSNKETAPSTASNNLSSASDMTKKSTLSVEAKEWYPPGYLNSNTSQSNEKLSAASQKHYPQNSVQSRLNRYKQSENDNSIDSKNDLDYDMDYLEEIIKTLTKSPGEFDDLAYVLVEYLEPRFNDIEFISKVTSAIFKQVLTAANFQYSGVRLFALLDKNCPLYRGCLHSLCEKELENTSTLPNVLLFYAELYSKLNYELFGKCLLKALQTLKPSPDNVKNICQTLKITGAKLELLDKQLITDLLNQLDLIRPSLTSSMSFLVESVIQLRNANWGQVDVQAVSPPSEPCDWSDGPVFYGPDGLQLTSEESEFLAENLNDFIIDDGGDPDSLWNPEQEMDEEIQAAFAEFVRSNNR